MPSLSSLFCLRRAGGWALLWLLLAGRPAAAQDWFDEVDVSAGYGVALLRWPTMQKFLDSYHQVNQAEVLTAGTIGRAPVRSVAVNFLNFAALRYERLGTEINTEFAVGTRHLNVQQNLLLISVEPAWRGEHLFIGPTFGLGAGTVVAYCSYRYRDGTESFGRERLLSGCYDAIAMPGFAGLRMGGYWGPALLTLRAEYMGGGVSDFDLDDDLPGDNADALPLDYPAFLASRAGFTVYDAVQADLSSIRFSVQLGVRLNRAD